MLQLNQKQRARISDKLADTANIGLAGLVFGQSLAGGTFPYGLAMLGIGLWVALMILSLWFEKGKRS